MKRDMDLARKILLDIEKSEEPAKWRFIRFEGHSNDEVAFHMRLLAQAGLIEAKNFSSQSRIDWRAGQLTWDGHEFLDAARDESRWNRAKEAATRKTGTLSFEVLKQVLVKLMLEAMNSQ